MGIEYLQRPSLIGPHLAAEARHVGEHDRGQLTRLGQHDAVRLSFHGMDYEARGCSMSNAAAGRAKAPLLRLPSVVIVILSR